MFFTGLSNGRQSRVPEKVNLVFLFFRFYKTVWASFFCLSFSLSITDVVKQEKHARSLVLQIWIKEQEDFNSFILFKSFCQISKLYCLFGKFQIGLSIKCLFINEIHSVRHFPDFIFRLFSSLLHVISSDVLLSLSALFSFVYPPYISSTRWLIFL